jgi:predicted lipid-binding transport protein (Tim44 family)
MNGPVFDVFSILTLVVAVIAVMRLKSVLGRRTGEDDERVQRRMRETNKPAEGATQSDKVVTLPRRERDPVQPALGLPEVAQDQLVAQRIKAIGGETPLTANLMEIVGADPEFNPDQFTTGAKRAYEMIVTAFAEGNRKGLRDLLSPPVFEEFARAITDRESRNEKIDQTFVGINKADIIDAEIERGAVQVTMRFVSQLITATRDKSGEVVAGDPTKVKDVTDLWTFSRDVSTAAARRNPNWKLVSTKHSN